MAEVTLMKKAVTTRIKNWFWANSLMQPSNTGHRIIVNCAQYKSVKMFQNFFSLTVWLNFTVLFRTLNAKYSQACHTPYFLEKWKSNAVEVHIVDLCRSGWLLTLVVTGIQDSTKVLFSWISLGFYCWIAYLFLTLCIHAYTCSYCMLASCSAVCGGLLQKPIYTIYCVPVAI